MANSKGIMARCLDGASYAAISATLGCSNRDIAKSETLSAGPDPVGADSLVSRLNAGQCIELGDYDMRQHLASATHGANE